MCPNAQTNLPTLHSDLEWWRGFQVIINTVGVSAAATVVYDEAASPASDLQP